VIGERYREAPQKDGRRRLPLLLLLLLPLSFALGGLSVEWLHGAPKASSPGKSSVPSAAAVQSGQTPFGSPTPSSSPTPESSGVSSVGGVAQVGEAGFTITGSVGNLMLGVATPLRLTLINPNGVPIYVTALTVSIAADSTPPGCRSASNVQLAQSNASSASPIVVPAGGSVTLTSPPRAPQITLVNLPGVNQDVCKGKSFALTYSGSAHS
jgi:hypothetical protein